MKKAKAYRYRGESLTLAEWAERLGTSYGVLAMRIRNGWPMARVLSEPVSRRPSGRSVGKKKRVRGRATSAVESEKPAAEAQRPDEAAPPAQGEAPSGGLPVPKAHRVSSREFLQGMAEGIWLTISSVAMMMAESGPETAGRNLQRIEDMFKGSFAEKFAAAVVEKPNASKAGR